MSEIVGIGIGTYVYNSSTAQEGSEAVRRTSGEARGEERGWWSGQWRWRWLVGSVGLGCWLGARTYSRDLLFVRPLSLTLCLLLPRIPCRISQCGGLVSRIDHGFAQLSDRTHTMILVAVEGQGRAVAE